MIAQQLSQAPMRDIAGTSRPPAFAQVHRFTADTGHFTTSNAGPDYFIQATTKGSEGRATFDGHKVHLSVHPQHFEQAFAALAPLLFSSQSPVARFKLTDIGRAYADASQLSNPAQQAAMLRVTEGAQFTLYLKSSPQTGHYDFSQMHRLKSFVVQCERSLQQAGVANGTSPASDAPISRYASYRNEGYQRSSSPTQVAALAQEPMYRLLSGA